MTVDTVLYRYMSMWLGLTYPTLRTEHAVYEQASVCGEFPLWRSTE
jgi:hypothetical protein